eukprot:scaffold290120_cov18-Tisochrysis_lutea.AAC.1
MEAMKEDHIHVKHLHTRTHAPLPLSAQAAIDKAFGSMEAMKEKFNAAAAGRFGSGWAWLGVKADGSLGITSTANQGWIRCHIVSGLTSSSAIHVNHDERMSGWSHCPLNHTSHGLQWWVFGRIGAILHQASRPVLQHVLFTTQGSACSAGVPACLIRCHWQPWRDCQNVAGKVNANCDVVGTGAGGDQKPL